MGKDIEFTYRGKGYTSTRRGKERSISEWYNEESERTYTTADDMLDNYVMDGVRLRDAFPEIEVLLH